MADFHKIHSKIWTDSWFYDLDHKHKLFFIYLFSNSRANIAGIYELPMPVMAAESQLAPDEIADAFDVFSKSGKAFYEDGVVWVKNLRQYHETQSPRLQKGIQKELDNIHDCPLKRRYLAYYSDDEDPIDEGGDTPSDDEINGMDTVSTPSIDRPSLVLSKSKSKSKSTARAGPTMADAVDVYENEIGTLSPHVSESLQKAIDAFGAKWVIDAIGVAVDNNKRKLSYVVGILENWHRDGRGPKALSNGQNAAEEAWSVVEAALNQGDAQPIMDRPDVLSAVNDCGRWPVFRDCRPDKLTWKKKEFVEAYNAQR